MVRDFHVKKDRCEGGKPQVCRFESRPAKGKRETEKTQGVPAMNVLDHGSRESIRDSESAQSRAALLIPSRGILDQIKQVSPIFSLLFSTNINSRVAVLSSLLVPGLRPVRLMSFHFIPFVARPIRGRTSRPEVDKD